MVLGVLLAARVHPVTCSGTGTCLEHSSPPSEPHRADHCDSYTAPCDPTSSLGDRVIIYLTSIVSVVATFPAFVRVIRLQPSSRSEDDTLFWWYLCFGSGGYIAWTYYYYECSDLSFSMFPVYVVSVVLAFAHVLLLICATLATSGEGDRRPYLMFVGPGVFWFFFLGMWYFHVGWIGWCALALSSVAHGFRFASTNYQDAAPDIDLCCSGTKVSFKKFSGFISLGGAIAGLLWLKNPQLCLSREFKLTSYIIALLRGWELFLWFSRDIARGLSKIEGRAEAM